MRPQRLAAIYLAAGLAGCATSSVGDLTVHVYSNQPGHADVLAVADQLEAAGYRHRITYAEPPGGLDAAETVIVIEHGDSAGAHKQAGELEALLSSPGERFRIQREHAGSRDFTAGKPGLYIYLPQAGREPELRVRAHFVGTCDGNAVQLFLFIDASYRLERRRRKGDSLLVDGGREGGDWSPDGSGFRLSSADGIDWALEPPLDDDPALRAFFVRRHPDFEGCRLAEPL